MGDSPRRLASSPTASVPAQALSPLVQLLPTGYRDIQPFQRGKGWHTNGSASKPISGKFRRPRDAVADASESDGKGVGERVVFPVIPTFDSKHRVTGADQNPSPGPSMWAAMDSSDCDERQEHEARNPLEQAQDAGGRKPTDVHALAPSIAAIPVPPSAPRRPSRSESNQQSAAPLSSSFRTRAIAAANGSAISSSSGLSAGVSTERLDDGSIRAPAYTSNDTQGATSLVSTSASMPTTPDPEVTARLWQEYIERTKPKTIDKETYHRKMQHKYSELKVMRERVSRLESELAETQRERDEAREAVAQSLQRPVILQRRDSNTTDDAGASHQSPQRPASGLSASVPRKLPLELSPEEGSYREKVFKLERVLAATKSTLGDNTVQLSALTEQNRETISTLEAKLLLEQATSQTLSKQLHDATAAFKAAADELVSTQIALERAQIHNSIVMEQIREQTNQLVSDHRRKELQNRVRNVIRNLGKEALHQKMEALHTRALVAEQSMRKAQLDVANLQAERDAQQTQLEQILSSSALKYHALGGDGGVPGILARATQLYYGTRVVTNQFLLVQILYEDDREPLASVSNDASRSNEMIDAFGNEPFRVHVVCYEALTAQDDFLTFQLRDIRRLVPEHEKYLARYDDRKHERLQELAEVLFTHVHAGYKNGHLVITESPGAVTPSSAGDGSDHHHVTVLRATRFVDVRASGSARSESAAVLTELVVNEVYAASTSELWWLEVRALVLEPDDLIDAGAEDNGCTSDSSEFSVVIDLHQLRSVCPHFGSYRPSESITERCAPDVASSDELCSIHEELLEPVLSNLVFAPRISKNSDASHSSSHIELKLEDPTASTDAREVADTLLQEPTAANNSDATALGTDSGSTLQLQDSSSNERRAPGTSIVLDHRCIVNIADVFYCVRIQEVWDAELMLDVTMEDPETLTTYACVVRESELVDIAQFLFESGLVDENYAALVKNGLPQTLHAPMCKLLKKHMQPVALVVDTHETHRSRDHNHDGAAHASKSKSVGKLSIDSLFRQVCSHPTRSRATTDVNGRGNSIGNSDGIDRTVQAHNRDDTKWRALVPLEPAVRPDTIASVTAQLCAWSAADARPHSTQLRKTRRGCRYLRVASSSSSSCCSEYVVVDIWSDFRDFAGLVLEIHLVSMSSTCMRDSESALRGNNERSESHDCCRLVITLQSLEDACRALGLASLSLS